MLCWSILLVNVSMQFPSRDLGQRGSEGGLRTLSTRLLMDTSSREQGNSTIVQYWNTTLSMA